MTGASVSRVALLRRPEEPTGYISRGHQEARCRCEALGECKGVGTKWVQVLSSDLPSTSAVPPAK